MRLSIATAALIAVLLLPAGARAGGDQATLSWTADAADGHALVTWVITGTTTWYVGVIQLATRPDLNGRGDFPPQNLVAYRVLHRVRQQGSWLSPFVLSPGTYYVQLTLRYDGPCETGCESRSSVRSLEIEPPPIGKVSWAAVARSGRVKVSWKPPADGWSFSLVLVDDHHDLSSPEDSASWPFGPPGSSWTSRRLAPDAYWVRLYARYEGCQTCLWTSKLRRVEIRASKRRSR